MAFVKESDHPKQAAIWQFFQKGDFIDSFEVASDLPPRQAADIITDFPGWARFLVAIRKLATTPLGLKQDGGAEDQVGAFPVISETENELIAGFDDKHLNFRVSIYSKDGKVHLATWVHRNNLLGRVYLRTIMPFHKLIARDALRRLAKA